MAAVTTRTASSLFGAALLSSAMLLLSPAAGAATVDIRIEKTGFVPATVTINAGDAVRWTNRDTADHQIVSETGAFASPILKANQSYSFTFPNGGTFRYRDGLKPAERGTVRVNAPPPSVTMNATPTVVVYGNQTHLVGTTSNKTAGEQVTIVQSVQGAPATQLTVVATAAGGTFDVPVAPAILTTFTAQYRGAQSSGVIVQVRPKVTLMPSGRGWFLTRVTGAHTFAGHWVYLQRRSGFGQWVSVQRYRLGAQSGKLFRIPKRKGVSRYRVFITINQAGSGYLESWSGTQVVRRR
jgi:plastocyanin